MTKTIYAVFLLACIMPSFCHAQNDTAYYDNDDNKVDFMSADHYRVIFPATDKKFKVEEHKLVRNRLTMTGYYTTINTNIYDDSVDIRDGYFIFYEYGHKTEEGNYGNNKREGLWKEYYLYSDTLHMTDTFLNGRREGQLISYYTDGKIKRKEAYSNDTSRGGKCFSEDGTEIPFIPYYKMPNPPYSLSNYLSRNLHYPENARQTNLEGKIFVKFIVGKDGSIQDAKIIKRDLKVSIDDSRYTLNEMKEKIETAKQALDSEAFHAISKMPAWVPGTEDGTPIKVSYNIPISFKLQ